MWIRKRDYYDLETRIKYLEAAMDQMKWGGNSWGDPIPGLRRLETEYLTTHEYVEGGWKPIK